MKVVLFVLGKLQKLFKYAEPPLPTELDEIKKELE
jgi:hypothetical protein